MIDSWIIECRTHPFGAIWWRFLFKQTHILQCMAISTKQIMIDAWIFEWRIHPFGATVGDL
jgi:hypothetical protein